MTPKPPIPGARACNIALRTGHIAAMGVLLGGHVFGIAAERLLPWLYLTIGTGSGLILLEAYPRWRWILEARGIMVIMKLLATCLVPWLWRYRVPILMGVVVLGSLGSHMPRRFRHASLLKSAAEARTHIPNRW